VTTHTHDHGDLPEIDLSTETAPVSNEDVLEALKDVVDPELGINVVDLGLVYDVHLDQSTNVVLDMTLTSAACPLTDLIEEQTNSALEGIVNDVTINWVWMPPWGPDKITDDGREQLRALGFNV
jgi:metal-sulfur cluster biosynthetic enzyme